MRISHSLAIMVVLVVIASAMHAFVVSRGGELSGGAGYLWYATFSYLVALAIEADRKSRQLAAPFEYGAFVFFAWPVAVPYYLFKVRGWRGLALGLGLILFASIPDFIAIATYFLVQD
jgi:hypothetical protein